MNPNLLLNADRRAKVEARVAECLQLAANQYKQEFAFPEIRYDIKNTNGGEAFWARNLIRLNLILMVENEEHFIRTTVAHEVAHLVARIVYHKKLLAEGKKMRPHGPQWKEVMALFEIPANTNHTYDTSSIERHPRRKRGSKLRGAEADLLLHRLGIAAKRLPKKHLGVLIANLLDFSIDLQ